MKIMVLSDLHNDVEALEKALEIYRREGYQKLYLLGDIIEDCVLVLNPLKRMITAVKGNCDSYAEEELAEFSLPYINYDYEFERTFLLTHGHYYNEYNCPDLHDVILMGHSHCSEIRKDFSDTIIANPGSLSRPRDGHRSYMKIDEEGIFIYDIDSSQIVREMRWGK